MKWHFPSLCTSLLCVPSNDGKMQQNKSKKKNTFSIIIQNILLLMKFWDWKTLVTWKHFTALNILFSGMWYEDPNSVCCVWVQPSKILLISWANKTCFWLLFEDLQVCVFNFLALSNWCSLHVIISKKHSPSKRKVKCPWLKNTVSFNTFCFYFHKTN